MCAGKMNKLTSEAMGRMWRVHAIEVDELGRRSERGWFANRGGYNNCLCLLVLSSGFHLLISIYDGSKLGLGVYNISL